MSSVYSLTTQELLSLFEPLPEPSMRRDLASAVVVFDVLGCHRPTAHAWIDKGTLVTFERREEMLQTAYKMGVPVITIHRRDLFTAECNPIGRSIDMALSRAVRVDIHPSV